MEYIREETNMPIDLRQCELGQTVDKIDASVQFTLRRARFLVPWRQAQLTAFPGVADWLKNNKESSGVFITKSKLSSYPKLLIYDVKPQRCYVPNQETYQFKQEETTIDRVFDLENEILFKEITLRGLTSDEISAKIDQALVE